VGSASFLVAYSKTPRQASTLHARKKKEQVFILWRSIPWTKGDCQEINLCRTNSPFVAGPFFAGKRNHPNPRRRVVVVW